MARRAKMQAMLEAAVEVLEAIHPMTVRQVFYQLVSRQVVENTRYQYERVSDLLRDARKDGTVPWEWIEDRTRRPRRVNMWSDLADFAETAQRAYRRDVWKTQAKLLEVWLEKDALSGIFEDALDPYGVTLNVGRGYDGWDSIHRAAVRYGASDEVTVLYFGDFDPSGEDMVRSLHARLAELGAEPEIIKCALTRDDINRYQLPPDFTKASDSRSPAFIAKYGDIAVELDALPVTVLRDRLVNEVELRMDLAALAAVRKVEKADRVRLAKALHRR